MKHLDTEILEAEIERLASLAGLPLKAEQTRDLALHLALVLEANKSFNLTAIRDPVEAARLHILDSLMALPEVQAAPPGTLVDMGSGAGFPGIPLGITAGRRAVLVESVGKKARFLVEVALALSPRHRISAEKTRAEDFGQQHPNTFAVATTRALSALPSLVELAAPMLQEHGVLVAMKGSVALEELVAGDRAGEIVGLRRISNREFNLPGGCESRSIIAYARVEEPRIPLPREVGRAQHRPLA